LPRPLQFKGRLRPVLNLTALPQLPPFPGLGRSGMLAGGGSRGGGRPLPEMPPLSDLRALLKYRLGMMLKAAREGRQGTLGQGQTKEQQQQTPQQ
jgi:hypothetical protein